jgi:hypothetical protein
MSIHLFHSKLTLSITMSNHHKNLFPSNLFAFLSETIPHEDLQYVTMAQIIWVKKFHGTHIHSSQIIAGLRSPCLSRILANVVRHE